MPNQVEFSAHFTTVFETLTTDEKFLIRDFVKHFRNNGLRGFKGKIGPSDNVPHADPDRARKIWFANHHKLWHVHIGHPNWNPCKNPLASYRTSDWVVHFQKLSDSHIAIVDYNSHNPMALPARSSLFYRR